MKTEIKNLEFKIEDADPKGIITGFASTFGNMDLGFDIIDSGAFKKTLKETAKIPILADHDPSKPIGWNYQAEETDKGLLVKGQLNMEDPIARARYALAKQALQIGAKMGLSIGYGVVKAEPDKDNPRIRRLKELKLYEYSIVVFPMNTQALVTAAKSYMDNNERDQWLKQVLNQSKTLGYSLSDLSNALDAVQAAEGSFEVDPLLIEQSNERASSKLDILIKLMKQ